MKLIQQYESNKCSSGTRRPTLNLYDYIYGVFDSSLDQSDDDVKYEVGIDVAATFSEDSHEFDEAELVHLQKNDSIDFKAETP